MSTLDYLIQVCRGLNNGIEWKIPEKLINVGGGINVLGGKFYRNLMVIWELSTCFLIFFEKKIEKY